MNRTVLITDITSYKAVVIARYLRRRYPDLRLVATDHRQTASWLRTRHVAEVEVVPAPPKAGQAYAEAIADVMRRHHADILIPVNSEEIRVLSAHRGLLGDALGWMGSEEIYRRLDDKSEFASLLQRARLPHPQTHSTAHAPLPLVVKPKLGSSAAGLVYLHTEDDRTRFIERFGDAPADCVIQDYFQGEGIGYSGFVREGRVLVGYGHRRVAEYPVTGGSSVVRERYPYGDVEALRALVERVLEVAPWSGFVMFEFKRNAYGQFVFIECNPRIWGSIHQGLADGVNYFEPLLGPPQATGRIEGCDRTSLSPLDLVAMAGYLRRGDFGKIGTYLAGLGTTRMDINPFSDPLGYAALLTRGG